MAHAEFSPQADGLTQQLARFVSTFRLSQLSPLALAVAKMGYMDCLGVALAGSAQPAGKIAARFAQSQQGAPVASVWGQRFATSPLLAALANGTAAHALDYDDVNWSLIGHPSVSLTASTLALGEQLGASGASVLEAYACGFEVMTKIGKSCQPAHSLEGGWHPTSTVGTIGATAACARLRGLDLEAARNALGIAVSHSSGVVQNFGTMTKPLHAGIAAQNGIQATGLALAGFTSSPDAMEGAHGFYGSYSRGLPLKLEVLHELGELFELDTSRLVIKPYPCGVAGHPAIDAALLLRRRLSPDGIKKIEKIEIGGTSYTIDKMRYLVPETGLQAKFSLTYQVARALVDGWIGMGAFSDEAALEGPIVELARRGSIFVDPEIEAEWRAKGGSRPCKVTLHLAGGEILEELVKISKGNPEVPLTEEELRQKFLDCAVLSLDRGKAVRLADQLQHMENVPDVGALGQMLAGME